MKLFLDTEFNGFRGELISMALVSEDGHRWYEVITWPDEIDPWVQSNVMIKLGKPSISLKAAKLSLHRWLSQFTNPTIICDWHADIEHFCAMLDGEDYASSVDFGCQFVLLSGPSDIKPMNPHNALSDAEALREWFLSRPKDEHSEVAA